MRLLIFCVFLLLTSGLSTAQDTRGSISGTVTDAQKATVAGAAVFIANTATGTSSRLTTNTSGYYEAPLLLPGDYRVTVENAGFKKSLHSGISLGIGDRLQIDVQLEVGGNPLHRSCHKSRVVSWLQPQCAGPSHAPAIR